MPSDSVTREIFGNLDAVSKGVFYALAVAAMTCFAYGIWRRVRYWRLGRSTEDTIEWGKVLQRCFSQILSQRTLRGVRRRATFAHRLLFWGFGVLFIGTLLVAVEHYGAAALGRPATDPIFHKGLYYGTTVEDIQSAGIVVCVIMPIVQITQSKKLIVACHLIDAEILYYIKKISKQELSLLDRRQATAESAGGFTRIITTLVDDYGFELQGRTLENPNLESIADRLISGETTEILSEELINGREFISLYYAVTLSGDRKIVGVISQPTDSADVGYLQMYFLLFSLLFLLLAVVAGAVVAKGITTPIRSLLRGIESLSDRIHHGSSFERIHVGTQDEISVLAEAFNKMGENLFRSDAELR